MLISSKFFKTQSQQNMHQTALNFQKNFGGASICPRTTLAYACNYNIIIST